MPEATRLRRYLAELVVVFVGVALAFAVENLREDLNERAVAEQYLSGFHRNLADDLQMVQAQHEARRAQLEDASVVLEFFDGRPIDTQAFFESYFSALRSLNTTPNRITIDEALSSGNLRLIRDARIRTGLLSLYATYDRIALLEEHMARDFDFYLYDPTFSRIPVRFEGPWPDTPASRRDMETLLDDVRVENGVRLIGANLQFPETGLLDELEVARSQIERLLEMISAG